mmetsp:Transcript_17948/g.31404  ORF Transcript_17948/g.31404 Transcript_17948/m.31404 type:complete len:171 (-) Transcript_17948:64-576(-)
MNICVILIIIFCLQVYAQTCSNEWDQFVIANDKEELFSVDKESGKTSIKNLMLGSGNALIDANKKIAELEQKIKALESRLDNLITVEDVSNTESSTRAVATCKGHAFGVNCVNSSQGPRDQAKRTATIQGNFCVCTHPWDDTDRNGNYRIPVGGCTLKCIKINSNATLAD